MCASQVDSSSTLNDLQSEEVDVEVDTSLVEDSGSEAEQDQDSDVDTIMDCLFGSDIDSEEDTIEFISLFTHKNYMLLLQMGPFFPCNSLHRAISPPVSIHT